MVDAGCRGPVARTFILGRPEVRRFSAVSHAVRGNTDLGIAHDSKAGETRYTKNELVGTKKIGEPQLTHIFSALN